MHSISTEIRSVLPSSSLDHTALIEHESRVETTHGTVILSGYMDLTSPNGETFDEVNEDYEIATAMVNEWIQTFAGSL